MLLLETRSRGSWAAGPAGGCAAAPGMALPVPWDMGPEKMGGYKGGQAPSHT